MNWLQIRLKELGYTHHDLQEKLAERGIERVRATITGWANDKPVSLLNDPEEAKKLADVLKWTVLEMFIAANYDINVPQELVPFIEAYKAGNKKQQEMYMQNLEFVIDFVGNLGEGLDKSSEEEET